MNEQNHRGVPTGEYKRLPVYSERGVHEACLEWIKQNVRRVSRCLDIAAGTGRFAQRLFDTGYIVDVNE